MLLKGKIKNVDICLINNVPFVYVACMGSYTNVPYKTPRELKEKYGKNRVAQIVTFGTMAARAALRDVGRAMGLSYATVDNVAKKIPRTLA